MQTATMKYKKHTKKSQCDNAPKHLALESFFQ
jgi:hypothetical protein